jgi:hypothetical protein
MKFSTIWVLLLLCLVLAGPRARAATRFLLPPGTTQPCSTDTALTVRSSGCNQVVISWQRGRKDAHVPTVGRASMVVMQDLSISSADPVPVWGTYYIGSNFFGAGSQLAPGQFVVYADTGRSVTVLGLTSNHTYRIDVIAYCQESDVYPSLDGPFFATADPGQATASTTPPQCSVTPPPTKGSYGASAVVLDCSTIRLSVHKGNGSGRMLVVQRVGAPGAVSPAPVNGTYYFPSPYFGQGQPVSPGSFVVQLGQDTTATVYGLLQNNAYKFFSFEYNADMFGQQPSYTAPLDTASVYMNGCLAPEPMMAARNLAQTDTAATTAKVKWTSGSGSKRLVIIRRIGGLTNGLSHPTQSTNYQAGGYGLGSEVQPGAWVVADTQDSTATIPNLEASSVYQAYVYEYNTFISGSQIWPTYLLSQAPAATLVFTNAIPVPVVVAPRNLKREFANATAYNRGVTGVSFTHGNEPHWVAFGRAVNDGQAPMMEPVDGVEYSQRFDGSLSLPDAQVGPNTFLLARRDSVSPLLALADTTFTMRNLSIGHEYEVVVYQYHMEPGTGPVYTPQPARLVYRSVRMLPVMNKSTITTGGIVTLRFSVPATYHAVAFRIEKAEDGEDFKPTTDQVLVGTDSTTTALSVAYTFANPIGVATSYRVLLTHRDGDSLYSANEVRLIPSQPLPVELVYFRGKLRADGHAVLSWGTASEKNSSYFELQRSTDGRNYSLVQTVAAAGTSTQARNYEQTDPLPLSKVTYYRLLQVDQDGTKNYSSVVPLAPGKLALQLNVWPNPVAAGELVNLRIDGLENQTTPVRVRVHSAASTKLVLDKTLPAGSVESSWIVTGWAAGVYLVEVQTAAGSKVTRLLVR